jgi:Zn-dependent protease with chaperone function
VQVAHAVLRPESHCCGTCLQPLFLRKDEPLHGIASGGYQHSLDRRMLTALHAIPGVPQAMRYTLEAIGDKAARILFMSEAIECGDDQFPELLELVDKAKWRLDLDIEPRLFLGESPHMNALTTGVGQPIIVVRSALLDQMDDDAVLAILGHELGHLHANHPLYMSVARALLQGGLATSALVRLLSLPIQRALLRWLRYAELTADRAALLASRDITCCVRMMLTFAGGNRPGTAERTRMRVAPFIRQCRELAGMQLRNGVDGMLGSYLAADRTHPFVAVRVVELIQWVEHGSYLDILAGDYPRRSAARRRRACRRQDEQA